jgi:D-tagatose-1,6-bisphosphate aldolase subunit GatZ/KbaZ
MNPIQHILAQQKMGIAAGIPSFCTAHPFVLETAVKAALQYGQPLLVEATCNQVNQYGGYTGMLPVDFYRMMSGLAQKHNLPLNQLILGGDHLGPSPWQDQPAERAMRQAEILVTDYVQAGFTKIHLDASMRLGDDDPQHPLAPELTAARSARLAKAAQSVCREGVPLNYIIGTEVPVPGGAREHEEGVCVTNPEDVRQTIEVTRQAFKQQGVESAWEQVIGIVVQPGVEFGDDFVLEYDPKKPRALSAYIETQPGLIYEAHSTDYQSESGLSQMVRDHFAILKVGPALTFAYREAVFALAQIEKELIPTDQQSHLPDVIDAVMIKEPEYWLKYYHGTESDQAFARKYSLSDRIRYYWPHQEIQKALREMYSNLEKKPIPGALLSQFLPDQYRKIRTGELPNSPEMIIRDQIWSEIQKYSRACSPVR